jgi:hypothetical protein
MIWCRAESIEEIVEVFTSPPSDLAEAWPVINEVLEHENCSISCQVESFGHRSHM